MTIGKVTEFKDSKGRVSGRIGPKFYAPMEVGLLVYKTVPWRKRDLQICLAVAKSESAMSPDAEGDLLRVGEQTDSSGKEHWGPSVQILQIRTIIEQSGKGTDRDIKALKKSTAFAIQAAYRMWNLREESRGKGKGWTHWGAFTNGAYEDNMPMAETVMKSMGVSLR